MARNKVHTGARASATAPQPDGVPPTVDNPNPQLGSGVNTLVERANDPTGDGKLTPAPMKGGSYGVIPEAVQKVHFHAGTPMRRGNAPVARKPKTFIVVGGPLNAQGRITFVYDHQRVSVMRGKEVTENTYDIDLLRRQGVQLEEVVDPLAEEQAVQLAAVEEVADGPRHESDEESPPDDNGSDSQEP